MVTKNADLQLIRYNNNKIIYNNITIWRIFVYFIIYSFIGYILETLFGIIAAGVVESRQSFLYGPFCAIYGLGAVVMILFLQFFNKNNYTLFLGGILIGSTTEFLISLIGEMIFHVKWWDYSDLPLNVDGRICVFYSLFWGILAIYLMTYLNPKIDNFIDWTKTKINNNFLKKIIIIFIIMLLIDYIISCFATTAFQTRIIVQHSIDVPQKEKIIKKYNEIYGNQFFNEFIYNFWGDKTMIRTFPNMRIQDKNGDIIYIKNLLPDIQSYYFKVTDLKHKMFQ